MINDRLMAMEMRLKIIIRSKRYDINRLRPGHGHKYTQIQNVCPYINQHLSNICSSINDKVK